MAMSAANQVRVSQAGPSARHSFQVMTPEMSSVDKPTSAAATEEIEKAMARREHLSKALSDAETNLRELMNGNEALAKELQARGVI